MLDGGKIATSSANDRLMHIMGPVVDVVRGEVVKDAKGTFTDPIGRGNPEMVLSPHRGSVPGMVSHALTVAMNWLDHVQRQDLEDLYEYI